MGKESCLSSACLILGGVGVHWLDFGIVVLMAQQLPQYL